MANQQLLSRLEAIRQTTMTKYQGGRGLSSVTTGSEREAFNQSLLEMVVAPPFRIGAGEITDANSSKSGPLDLVIEHSASLSFPMEPGGRRLYLAEGIAAVIEVKSNLPSQWADALSEGKKVNALHKSTTASISFGAGPTPYIPFAVAGFIGWQQLATYDEKIAEPAIDAILSLEPPIFVSKLGVRATGTAALLGFFVYLQHHMKSIMGVSVDYAKYAS